jgi:hypothetical protein
MVQRGGGIYRIKLSCDVVIHMRGNARQRGVISDPLPNLGNALIKEAFSCHWILLFSF